MTTALTVAQYISKYYKNITFSKLKMLLYYSQGIHIAMYDKRLFKDDLIACDEGIIIKERPKKPTTLTQKEINVINEVISKYGQFAEWCLLEKIKLEDPWQNTSEPEEIISYEDMQDFFINEVIK